MAINENRLETLDFLFTNFVDETNGRCDRASFGAILEAALHKHKVHYGSNTLSWTNFIVGLVSTVFASDVAVRNSVTQAFMAMTNHPVWFSVVVEEKMKIFLFQKKNRRLQSVDTESVHNLKVVVRDNGFPMHMVDDALSRVEFVTLDQTVTRYNENNDNVRIRATIRNWPFSVTTSRGAIRSEKLFEGIRALRFYPLANTNENNIRFRLNKIFTPMALSDFKPTQSSPTAPLAPTFFIESLDFCLQNSGLLNYRFENYMNFNGFYFFMKGATMNFESTFQLDVISRYAEDGSVIDLTIMSNANKGHFVSEAMPTILTLRNEGRAIVDDDRLNVLLLAPIQTECSHYIYLDSFIDASPVRYNSDLRNVLDNSRISHDHIPHFSPFNALWRSEQEENFKISVIYHEIMKSVYLGYKDSLPHHIFGCLLGTQLPPGVEIHRFVYNDATIAQFVHTFVCRYGEAAIILNLAYQIDGKPSHNVLTDFPIAGYLKPHLMELGVKTVNVYNSELGSHVSVSGIAHDVENANWLVRTVRSAEQNSGWGADTVYYKQPFYYNPDQPLEGVVSSVRGVTVSEIEFVRNANLGGVIHTAQTMTSRFSMYWPTQLGTDHSEFIDHIIRQAWYCEFLQHMDSSHLNVLFAAAMSSGVHVVRMSDGENLRITALLRTTRSDRPFCYTLVYNRPARRLHDIQDQVSADNDQLSRNSDSAHATLLHIVVLQHTASGNPQMIICSPP